MVGLSGWMTTLTGHPATRSPGRPPVRRDVERAFWGRIAEGLTSEAASPTPIVANLPLPHLLRNVVEYVQDMPGEHDGSGVVEVRMLHKRLGHQLNAVFVAGDVRVRACHDWSFTEMGWEDVGRVNRLIDITRGRICLIVTRSWTAAQWSAPQTAHSRCSAL